MDREFRTRDERKVKTVFASDEMTFAAQSMLSILCMCFSLPVSVRIDAHDCARRRNRNRVNFCVLYLDREYSSSSGEELLLYSQSILMKAHPSQLAFWCMW